MQKIKYFRNHDSLIEECLWPNTGTCQPDPTDNVRYLAIHEVLCRLPDSPFKILSAKTDEFDWFIPDTDQAAEIVQFSVTHDEKSTKGTRNRYTKVLYLSPDLDNQELDSVIAIIIGELAHIILDHNEYPGVEESINQEQEAFDSMILWGFKREAIKRIKSHKQGILI